MSLPLPREEVFAFSRMLPTCSTSPLRNYTSGSSHHSRSRWKKGPQSTTGCAFSGFLSAGRHVYWTGCHPTGSWTNRYVDLTASGDTPIGSTAKSNRRSSKTWCTTGCRSGRLAICSIHWCDYNWKGSSGFGAQPYEATSSEQPTSEPWDGRIHDVAPHGAPKVTGRLC